MVLKQGQFFTLSALFFVAVLILLFTGEQRTSTIDTGTLMVETTNSYRERIENNYLPVLVKQYSYLTLVALSNDAYESIVPGPAYILSLPTDFQDAIISGAYQSHSLSGFTTLTTALENLSNISKEIGYTLNFSINSIDIIQSGAYQAVVTYNISYNLSSRDSTVIFRTTSIKQEIFSLIGIPDLYYNRFIFGTPENYRYLQPSLQSQWNTTAFQQFVVSKNYTTNNESPSFFNRLQNNPAASPFGVETMIPITKIPEENLTSVDYEYITSTMYNCTYAHPSMLAVHLDIKHITNYNILDAEIVDDDGTCPPAPWS